MNINLRRFSGLFKCQFHSATTHIFSASTYILKRLYCIVLDVGIGSQNSLDTKFMHVQKRAQQRCKPAFVSNSLYGVRATQLEFTSNCMSSDFLRKEENNNNTFANLNTKSRYSIQPKFISHHRLRFFLPCLFASVQVNGPSEIRR